MVVAALVGLVAQALPALEAAPTRWALEAGYSRRFWEESATDSPDQRAYLDQARKGWHLGADVSAIEPPTR